MAAVAKRPTAGSTGLAQLTELSRCLSGLDREAAMTSVAAARADGADSVSLITGLLAPALTEVGRQWAACEIGAAEAMAAAAIVRSCIPQGAGPPLLPGTARQAVLVCCPPGEQHEIPAQMVTEMLRQYGWSALNLGAGATPQQLPRFLDEQHPAALLVSASTACGLAGTAQVIAVAHGRGIPVMVGGAAFGRDDLLALRLGAAGWAASAAQAVVLLKAWRNAPPVLAPIQALPEEYLRFTADLPGITASAIAAVRLDQRRRQFDRPDQETSQTDDPGTHVELLLRHLEATLVVEDGRIFHDFVSHRLEYYRARDVDPTRLDQALQAVADCLPPECGRARELIAEGRRHLAWAAQSPTVLNGWRPAPSQMAPRDAAPDPVTPFTPVTPVTRLPSAGQVFSDLLFVAASITRSPMAWLSVARPDGLWSTLRHNADGEAIRRELPGESQLLTLIASGVDPTEIGDLAAHPELSASTVAHRPGGIRFVYGIPLRTRRGDLVGVLCLLDRHPRTLTRREQQAAAAIARQLTGQLAHWHTNEPPAPEHHRASRAAPQRRRPGGDDLMRSREVASLFDVTDRTVCNWAAANRIPSLRTTGKQLRFRRHDVLALLAGTAITP
jgi:excisionase family DNA binding protein